MIARGDDLIGALEPFGSDSFLFRIGFGNPCDLSRHYKFLALLEFASQSIAPSSIVKWTESADTAPFSMNSIFYRPRMGILIPRADNDLSKTSIGIPDRTCYCN